MPHNPPAIEDIIRMCSISSILHRVTNAALDAPDAPNDVYEDHLHAPRVSRYFTCSPESPQYFLFTDQVELI